MLIYLARQERNMYLAYYCQHFAQTAGIPKKMLLPPQKYEIPEGPAISIYTPPQIVAHFEAQGYSSWRTEELITLKMR